MRPDVMTLLEAAYDLDAPSAEWHESLVAAAGRSFPGTSGTYSYLYQVHDDQPRPTSAILGDTCFLDSAELRHVVVDPVKALRVYKAASHAESMTLCHEDPVTRRLPEGLGEVWSRYGVSDILAILARRASGDSLALGLALDRRANPEVHGPAEQIRSRRGTLIARHLETAMAIREALGHEGAIVADLDERGRGDIRPGASLSPEQVLDAGRRMEKARARVHEGDVEALDVWTGLLQGRWSIVRHRRGGGRLRFLVVENPEQDSLRVLSPLEREIVVRVATGEANKVLAIDLQLHPSTVANVLARALRKLGIGNRVLLALLARILVPSTSSTS